MNATTSAAGSTWRVPLNTEGPAMPGDPQQEIIAYLLGSFWLCFPCARDRDDFKNLGSARRADLMPVDTYHCDQCRRSIA
ncbi:hypothetical protein ACH4Y0_02635 [Streptomyces sp. NPDC020707]|uniref:hypothetical protein n=1 Tax=Streptomyces sp. NPDC020707 TaxID=3365084 RepID=UPI00379377A0